MYTSKMSFSYNLPLWTVMKMLLTSWFSLDPQTIHPILIVNYTTVIKFKNVYVETATHIYVCLLIKACPTINISII